MKRAKRNTKKETFTILIHILTSFILSLPFSGCEEETRPEMIVGRWKSDDVVCGDPDSMKVEDDLTGEARLHFYWNDKCYYDDFDLEVVVTTSQERYEIDFESQNDSDNDFTMDCEVRKDTIDCDGDDLFEAFEWTWEDD